MDNWIENLNDEQLVATIAELEAEKLRREIEYADESTTQDSVATAG